MYNAVTSAATIRHIRANATNTYLGVNNADILANLQTRVVQLVDVVRSGDHLWYLGQSFPNTLSVISILFTFTVILASCILDKYSRWEKLLFAPVVLLVTVILSSFTISSLWPTHFAVIVTMPAIIFGSGVQVLFDTFNGFNYRYRMALRSLVVVFSFFVFLIQINASLNYLNAVKTTGGLSFHSSAIYDVYRFLENRSERLVALDWGLAAQLEYLSGGRLRVEEWYNYDQQVSEDFYRELRAQLSKDSLYLTHAMHQEAFQRREVFLEAATAAGFQAQTVNVSIRTDGWPMIEVWQLK